MTFTLHGRVLALHDGHLVVRTDGGAEQRVQTPWPAAEAPLKPGHRIRAVGGPDAEGTFRLSGLWRVRRWRPDEEIDVRPGR